MNNFKRFGKGIQIEPGFLADPLSGRKGEIFWNLTTETLRVNVAPTQWRNLLLPASLEADSSLSWDTISADWKVNNSVKIGNYSLYGKTDTVADGVAAADMLISASNKSFGTGNGGNLILHAGDSFGGIAGKVVFQASLIDANVNRIINVVDPTAPQDAATKNYVDDVATKAGGRKLIGGGTLTSTLVSNVVSATLNAATNSVDLAGATGDGQGQTFLATASGALVSIDVELEGTNVGNFYNIDIYETDGIDPIGSPIATSDDFDAGTVGPVMGTHTFTFTSGPILLAGTTYFFHVRAKSGSVLAGFIARGGNDVSQVEEFDFTGLTGASFDVGIGGSPGLKLNLADSIGYVWFNVQDGLTQTDPGGVGVGIQVDINLADNGTALALAAKNAIDLFGLVASTIATLDVLQINYFPGALGSNGDAGTSGTAYTLIEAGVTGVDAYADGRQYTVDPGPAFVQGSTEDLDFEVIVTGAIEISMTADMYVETKGLDYADNTILAASIMELPADQYVSYVIPNLTAGGPVLVPTPSALADVPANAIVIARREGNDVIVGTSSTRYGIGDSGKLYTDVGGAGGAPKIIGGGTVAWSGLTSIGTILAQQPGLSTNELDATTLNDYSAQGINFATAVSFDTMRVSLRKNGSPTGNLVIEIVNDLAGDPNELSVIAQSNPVSIASLSTAETFTQFTFPSSVSLSASTQYHFIIRPLAGAVLDSTNRWERKYTTAATYPGGVGKYSGNAGSSWSNMGGDIPFQIGQPNAQSWSSFAALPYTASDVNANGNTFLATLTGTLTKVTVNLSYSAPTTGNLYIKIYNTSAGLPTGAAIATSNAFDSSTLTATLTPVAFTFPSAVTLNSGTTYAFAVEGQSGGSTINLAYATSSVYVDGTRVQKVAGVWSAVAGHEITPFIVETSSLPVLSFTAPFYLESKGLAYIDNTLPITESPISLPNDKDVAYIEPNKNPGGPNLTVTVDTLDNVPKNAVIIARRDGNSAIVGSSSTLLKAGQSADLYAQASNQLLAYIGAPNTATSSPTYSSTNNILNGDSLLAAIGKIDTAVPAGGSANRFLSNLQTTTLINTNLSFDTLSDKSVVIPITVAAVAGRNLTIQAGQSNLTTGGGGALTLRAGVSGATYSGGGWANGAPVVIQSASLNGAYRNMLAITPTQLNRTDFTFGNPAVDYMLLSLADSTSGRMLMKFYSPAYSSPVDISGSDKNASGPGAGPVFHIYAGSGFTTGAGGEMRMSGGTAAGTDQAGGVLTLRSGIATGNGSGTVLIQAVTAGQGTGTAQRIPTTIMSITGTGTTHTGTFAAATNNFYDIGSSAVNWRIVYSRMFIANNAPSFFGTDFNSALVANFQSGESNTAAATGNAIFRSGDQISFGTGIVGTATFRSGNTAVGNTNPTGIVTLKSGDALGSGASGAVLISSGISTVGTGTIFIDSGSSSGTGSSGDVRFRSGNKSAGTGSTGAASFGSGINSITGNNTGVVTLSSGDNTFTNGGSGAVNVSSGAVTGAGSLSGPVNISTGASVGGTRGNIVLDANGVNYTNARAVSDFYPKASSTYDNGDVNLRWKDTWSTSFKSNYFWAAAQTLPSGAVSVGAFGGLKLVDVGIFTGNNSDADTVATRHAYVETGNKTIGTANSGNIYLTTGLSTATRGSVIVNADALNVQAARFGITGEVSSNLPAQFNTLTVGTPAAPWGAFIGKKVVIETKIEQTGQNALVLTDNSTNAVLLTFVSATTNALKIDYMIKEDTANKFRTGTLHIANDGTSPQVSDQYAQTSDPGVTWSVGINGANLELKYTTTSTGNNRTARMSVTNLLI